MKNKKICKNEDSEKRFNFENLGFYVKLKDIKRIFLKRRKLLLTGHCVRCVEYLKNKKIKKIICPNCNTNLEEFCFEEDLTNRENEIKEAIKYITKK